ncbi:MAG: hypothetical protein WC856_07915 [Methylococcaceae bacterium]|jgi:hypothetical protein
MTTSSTKQSRIGLKVNDETRVMLEKLTKIHDRPMTGVIEQLIKKEAKEYGLIESRE